MSDTDPTKNRGLNPGSRDGYASRLLQDTRHVTRYSQCVLGHH